MKGNQRQEALNKELINYNPKRWRFNMPFKDYRFKIEDTVPALSGAIGKVSLVAAFAMAWAAGLSIADPTFVAENVRLEIVIAGLFTVLFCGFFNPYAGPPGTLAPLIPVVSVMALAGVHPLPLGILIGAIGLLISLFKFFCRLIRVNGEGTKGGIILLFGILGIISSLEGLQNWAAEAQAASLFVLLLVAGIALYLLLTRLGLKWLVIPACAVLALLLAAAFGLFPFFKTEPGLPILSPDVWWNQKWGIGFGLNMQNFIKAVPYALLAVVLWPMDALAITTIQEKCYPPEAKNAVICLDSTYTIVSLRNIVGTVLGGSQIAAVWRSFMIPLGIVKRPVGASALMLGLLGIAFGLFGFPIDVAIFPPLLWLVLIFGVYVPLIEVGLSTIKTPASAQTAAICVIGGVAINPVVGWIFAVLAENFGIIRDPGGSRQISKNDKLITGVLAVAVIMAFIFSNPA